MSIVPSNSVLNSSAFQCHRQTPKNIHHQLSQQHNNNIKQRPLYGDERLQRISERVDDERQRIDVRQLRLEQLVSNLLAPAKKK
jgi:hypothetical protein